MQHRGVISFESDGRGMLFTGAGVISGEQLIRLSESSCPANLAADFLYQIIDLRNVHRLDITADQIRQLAALNCQAAERSAGMQTAIIATHDLTIGLSRLYSAYARSPKLQVGIFPSPEQARDWMDQPANDAKVSSA